MHKYPMRKYITIVESVTEDCVEHDAIKKGSWTDWQDRDGIYVVRSGSASVYAGFCEQEEAEQFAAKLGAPWRVIRWGRYKTMTDAAAKNDPEIRRNRIRYGFYVEPLSENELDSDSDDLRAADLERSIREVCESQFGWEFEGVSYPVVFDETSGEVTITPVDEEFSLEQLERLKMFGSEVAVSLVYGQNRMSVRIKTHPDLAITRQS